MVLTRDIKQLATKITSVIIIFLLWLLYRLVIISVDNKGYVDSKRCFKDIILLDFLNGLTRFLASDLQYRDYALIFGSSVLDITFLFVLIHFILYGNSSRLIFSLGIFYPLRTVLQLTFLLQWYDTFIFDFPGFYSLVVPLHPGTDFFFSGHIGSTTICMLYFRDNFRERIFYYLSIPIVFLEGFVMLSLRGHYFIDLVFGFIVSHYVYIHAEILSNLLDNKWPIFGRKLKISEKDSRSIETSFDLIVINKTPINN